MKLYLNDEPITQAVASVAEAIDVGGEQAREAGDVIVDVLVDGRPLTDDELDRVCDHGAEIPADEVRLISANPTELMRSTLTEAMETLTEATEAMRVVGELIQAGKGGEAMPALSEPLESWGAVHQAAVHCGMMMGVDFATLEIAGEPAEAIVSGLADRLRQIRNAMAEQDEVALADELTYETADTAARWHDLLTAMRDLLDT
ncbi:MAG: hypothetical protein KAS72_15245 [Phycisphaerales bacterium]|nr:hypothetical protein [Phycisphaerales bacterium]